MKVANQAALTIIHDAIAQNEIVHSAADIDGINLNKTKVIESGGNGGDRSIEH